MIIVAGGDSFIYGSELNDCDKRGTTQYSRNTFTSLLATQSGFDYECVAWPGYGNDSIARNVINFCETHKDQKKFVIVSWTFPGRYEFRFNYNTQQRSGNWYTITPWTIAEDNAMFLKDFKNQNEEVLKGHETHLARAKQIGTHEFAQSFYKHVGSSEFWKIYASLKEIVYLQNYLKNNNIGFLFTCASTDIFINSTVRTEKDLSVMSLYNQIDFDKWYIFNNTTDLGFYQWADFYKYPIGTTHPLEQAHADAAKLMKDKFNELVKTYLEQDQIGNSIS